MSGLRGRPNRIVHVEGNVIQAADLLPGEVNHVGYFLCRSRDCLLLLIVELYQGVGTPLGGRSGIRDCGNRRSLSFRLSDVCVASTGKILRW